MTKPKRPRDPNQLGKLIVEIATGEVADAAPDEGKDKAAVEMGRKGGRARSETLTAERRVEIAKKAAKHRWAQPDQTQCSENQKRKKG